MNTITFKVSGTKEIEPTSFMYGVVVESSAKDQSGINKSLEELLAKHTLIEKSAIPNETYLIPESMEDLYAIHIYKIRGRIALNNFVTSLRSITGVRGGIINIEAENVEATEFELINELTEEAKQKANSYASIIGKSIKGINSFKIEEGNKGGWRAFPPVRRLNRETIFNAIFLNFDKKDMYVIDRTIEIQFEFY